MDTKTQKQLLKIQSQLKAIIDRLETKKATLPTGAFQGLTTAEDELGNALGKLERPASWQLKVQLADKESWGGGLVMESTNGRP